VFRSRTDAEIQALANRKIRRNAALLYGAGVVAQLIYDGARSPHLGPGDPIAGCDSIVADLVGDRFKRADGGYDDAIALEIDKYRRQAWRLLRRASNWRAVEALAAAVRAEGALTGETALTILKEARGRRPRRPSSRMSAEEHRIVLSDSLEAFLREIGRKLDDPDSPR
jgi:hypothetical protein